MNYKKKISIIGIIVFFTVLVANTYATTKSFIWEIKTKNKKSSYLVGSIHMLDKSVYPLNDVFEKAFKVSDCLVVEANVADEKKMELGLLTMKLGTYKDEKTLKNSISPETYKLASEKLKSLGLDITGLNKFKPWMVAMTIAATEMMQMGFNPDLGIDRHFLNMANSKEILELEGAKFQINLFNGLSEEEQELFLFHTVTDESNTELEFKAMIKAWLAGDDKELEELVERNIKKYPKLKGMYYKLVDERNVNMTKTIDDFIKTTPKTYFVVVGAAHLVGKNGLINLLKKKGYTLKQL